ncbi:MAG: hypothetical protein WA191_01540 [Telluria sp.]|nr:hypothetical protein [Telluria sp.]
MSFIHIMPASPPHGLLLRGMRGAAPATRDAVLALLDASELAGVVEANAGADARGAFIRLSLCEAEKSAWMPGADTLGLCARLQLDPLESAADLKREIVLALLACPQPVDFPSVDELLSAVRMRCHIVQAGRKTTLAFETSDAERPQDCWTYVRGKGFILLPGVSLITALKKATQPEVSGTLYSFSCYRASEYVILLALAEELALANPAMFARLQALWNERAIMSGEFHEVFLRELGSMEQPLPPDYYVPGDRVWFRNPDEASAEASGFEGSWLLYLGNGLFANFWERDRPYTKTDKCIELYHWRNATFLDREGELRIDEAKVCTLVQATRSDPAEVARIVALMWRYRGARGVYGESGCVDTTREFLRWVRPGTADLVLPLQ